MKNIAKKIVLGIALLMILNFNTKSYAETVKETKKEDKKTNKIIENVNQFGSKFGNMPSRQFMTVKTKQGNILYLLIDYTDVGEEVKLLTEVSDTDVLKMTSPELKQEIQNQISKNTKNVETNLEENKNKITKENEMINEEQNENASLSTFQIILIVLCLGGAVTVLIIKFKKSKKKSDYDL